MHLPFVLCTIVTTLVLVQGQESIQPEPDRPHKYTVLGQCKSVWKELRSTYKNAVLKPRERHVILKPEPGYEFMPRTVTVKRCLGYCPNRYSPMPDNSVPKSFVVQLSPYGDKSSEKCVSVTVMEHKHCTCMCMKNETHCNELQQWHEPNCACLCKERGMKKPACEATGRMVWNDENCSCQCPDKIMDCPHGMKWDDNVCECVEIWRH